MATADRTWWRPFRTIDGASVIHVDLRPHPGREKEATAWLDQAESERLGRFRIERPRRDFALCRAALRVHLCERLDCANDALSFGFHEHGKPFARVDERPVPISFNVSHSAPHGLIAFAPQGRLGVDRGGAPAGARFRRDFHESVRSGGESGGCRRLGRGQAPTVLPALDVQGGAHQGTWHGVHTQSLELRSARGHDSRGGLGDVPVSPRPGGRMANHMAGQCRIRRGDRPGGRFPQGVRRSSQPANPVQQRHGRALPGPPGSSGTRGKAPSAGPAQPSVSNSPSISLVRGSSEENSRCSSWLWAP